VFLLRVASRQFDVFYCFLTTLDEMKREYLYRHKVIYEHDVCTKIRTKVIPPIVNNSVSHTKLGIKERKNYVQFEGIVFYM